MTPAPDLDALIERLQLTALAWSSDENLGDAARDAKEAAAALSALREERDRLAWQVKGLKEGWDSDADHVRAERDAALADARRYRFACEHPDGWWPLKFNTDKAAIDAAIDAALAAKEQP